MFYTRICKGVSRATTLNIWQIYLLKCRNAGIFLIKKITSPEVEGLNLYYSSLFKFFEQLTSLTKLYYFTYRQTGCQEHGGSAAEPIRHTPKHDRTEQHSHHEKRLGHSPEVGAVTNEVPLQQNKIICLLLHII